MAESFSFTHGIQLSLAIKVVITKYMIFFKKNNKINNQTKLKKINDDNNLKTNALFNGPKQIGGGVCPISVKWRFMAF
jgi:hypothetical protein